jgi:hypothetical protein
LPSEQAILFKQFEMQFHFQAALVLMGMQRIYV